MAIRHFCCYWFYFIKTRTCLCQRNGECKESPVSGAGCRCVMDRVKHVRRRWAVEKATVSNGGGQLTGLVLHFRGMIQYGFSLGKLVVTSALCRCPGISRGRTRGVLPHLWVLPGQSRGEPRGKHLGPKSKDSKAAWASGREDCTLHYRVSLVHSSEGIVKRRITLFVKSCCPFPLWHPLVGLGKEHLQWRKGNFCFALHTERPCHVWCKEDVQRGPDLP